MDKMYNCDFIAKSLVADEGCATNCPGVTHRIEVACFFQHGRTSYFIAKDGRVLSAPTAAVLDVSPSSPGALCKEIASFNGKGYRRVRLAGKNFKVHRLVAEAFVPNPDNLPHVIHIDGNRTNNHFSNLAFPSCSLHTDSAMLQARSN